MTRDVGTGEAATLAVLGIGIAGFVVLQSYLLVESGLGDTGRVARAVWFAGLVLGGALLAVVVPTADGDR